MQFKNYGIHMYGVMANLLKTSLEHAPSAERAEARKAFAGVLASHALMAGGLTLIADPLRLVGGLYDWITGAQHPHDYQADVRGFLSDTFGPELGEIVARGVPHAVGIDIHNRVGLSNLLELPEIDSFDSKGFISAVGTMLTGASGEDALNMVNGIKQMWNGDYLKGSEALLPRIIADPMKAYGLAENGVPGTKGGQGLPASRISTGDVLARAVGFQPSDVTEYREGREAVQQAMQETKSTRNSLISGWVQAVGDDRGAVMAQIRQFNEQNPGEAIQMPQLVRALQAARTARVQPGSFGLRLPPKTAATLARAGRFANVGAS
jgi:hypothetical protein